ncbi:uncharacterized protein LY89DRAFT_674189 [Mollisia scopiformis]|uniref:Uncharacterized protein n=1 Tax=Mollisia scopiformis TaxID=149040 RepID=A0A194WUH2_MOLSC|nr:uncharacterized protein LY89DRAFT_674189 [Mollisia scopiformis]KUJ11613.1 hypothetical protein LY89DRAFT_674189 [Mollisia scopiformis]
MSNIVLPYSAHHYNSLPDIMDASLNFKPTDATFLTTIIGQLFVKHQVQKHFGIILLHKHFPLDENEKLVNCQAVAVPWKTSSHDEQMSAALEPFLSELRAVLKRLGLLEKLGICAFTSEDADSDAQMEFTLGRANITLLFDVDPGDDSIDAVWKFEQPSEFDSLTFIRSSHPSPVLCCSWTMQTSLQSRSLWTSEKTH